MWEEMRERLRVFFVYCYFSYLMCWCNASVGTRISRPRDSERGFWGEAHICIYIRPSGALYRLSERKAMHTNETKSNPPIFCILHLVAAIDAANFEVSS